jgi:ribosome biogenesis GTPase
METALVVKSTGSWYDLVLENGERVKARMVGKFRLGAYKLTNPVAVGDMVDVLIKGESVSIKKVHSRKNYIVRQSPRKKHYLHLLASNIDQAVLITTIVNPKLKQGFIDRFLLMTEPHNIPVVIIFNKSDLYSEEDLSIYQYLHDIYTDIGYEVRLCSAENGHGIEQIAKDLEGKLSLIAGQSGVGKSTIVNAIEPGLELKTDELSDYTGKGQHTTTFAEMLTLSNGGRIIDTPGLKTLSFNNLQVQDVSHNFREFFEESVRCRFNDCLHMNEPGCAVLKAIEEGRISELRHMNYEQIISEIEDQNRWELHSEM